MILEAFNDRDSCFKFDLKSGSVVLSTCSNENFSGVGTSNECGFSALYVLNEKLYLFVNSENIDVSGDGIDYKYRHDDGGVTHFSVFKNGNKCVEISYPCWMEKRATEPVGFGMADDDDEDFFAYVKLMLEAENRKLHLLKKYSI